MNRSFPAPRSRTRRRRFEVGSSRRSRRQHPTGPSRCGRRGARRTLCRSCSTISASVSWSRYGGPIEAPNITTLAESGLRFTNFHTTRSARRQSRGVPDGSQPPLRRFQHDRRDGHRLSRAQLFLPPSAATMAEVLKSERLLDVLHRQVAPDADLRGDGGRTVRALAARARLRSVLRLPPRRDRSLASDPDGQTTTACPRRSTTATTSPTTSSITSSRCCVTSNRWRRGVRSSLPAVRRRALSVPRTSGRSSTSIAVRSTMVGTCIAVGPSSGRRNSASSRPTTNCRPRTRAYALGTTLTRSSERSTARLMEVFAGMVDPRRRADRPTDVGAARTRGVRRHRGDGAVGQRGRARRVSRTATTNTERFRNLMPMTLAEMLPVRRRPRCGHHRSALPDGLGDGG